MKRRGVKNIVFALIIISLLCSGCKPKYTGEDYEAIHTCEVVEDITQEEIVSFENMLITYSLTQNRLMEYGGMEYIYPTICVFSDGSVYCFKQYLSMDDDNQVPYFGMCSDDMWSHMQEIYYLGRLSGEELFDLTYYISKVDVNSGVYNQIAFPETVPCAERSIGGGYWLNAHFQIIYENENGEIKRLGVQGVSHEGDRIRVSYQILDSDALNAMDILTESWFYETWLELIFEEAE